MAVKDKIAAAVNTVGDKRAALAQLEEDNPEIFREYFDRITDYNTAIAEARDVIGEDRFDGDSKMYPGGFKAVKRFDRSYNVEILRDLCPEIFNVRGVVKTVDTKVVATIRSMDAFVDDAKVGKAYSEKLKSTAIYGPKELKLKMT